MSNKKPTIKRILKEAHELETQPSADFHAAPLETDLFEWHFTLRGPPAPSPYDGGIYHGRIILPPAYPLKPPSFRFLTPNGRFETNREICLSISGHHEETWQPAWGIRTALVAIRSFMDTEAKGQLGGLDASSEVRKRQAAESGKFACGMCGRSNEGIMKEVESSIKRQEGASADANAAQPEVVPKELRLAYREELQGNAVEGNSSQVVVPTVMPAVLPPTSAPQPANATSQMPIGSTTRAHSTDTPHRQVQHTRQDRPPAWIDKAIYGVVAALIFFMWKKFLL